jgi:hypothetical protein
VVVHDVRREVRARIGRHHDERHAEPRWLDVEAADEGQRPLTGPDHGLQTSVPSLFPTSPLQGSTRLGLPFCVPSIFVHDSHPITQPPFDA